MPVIEWLQSVPRRRHFICASMFLVICGSTATWPARAVEPDEIRALLRTQAQAWNDHNLDRFMDGYAEQSIYISCDSVMIYGRNNIRAHYMVAYENGTPTGVLTLSDENIKLLGAKVASVFLHWSLQQGNKTEQGVDALLLRKTERDGWKITADHTSTVDGC